MLFRSGLLLASFRRVLTVDPGFRQEGLLTASVNLPSLRYADNAGVRRFTDAALRAMRAIAGTVSVGATNLIPFGTSFSQSLILAEGHQMKPGESMIAPYMSTVTPGYFEAMGARLVSGQFFDNRNGPDSRRAVIVDERLARRFWPGADPVGRRMYLPSDPNDPTAITASTQWFTVVGVVGEMKLRGLVEGVGDVGAYYFTQAQNPARNLTFVLRSTTPPSSLGRVVRTEMARLDPELPVFDVQTMTDRMGRSLMSRRSPMLVAMAFGLVALFLSAIGIYGIQIGRASCRERV